MSNQCMALVNDDCLIPTKDAPELGYIKESSEKQYVPDVFYKVCGQICHMTQCELMIQGDINNTCPAVSYMNADRLVLSGTSLLYCF